MAQEPVAYHVLLIGGSAGGLDAILQIFPGLQPREDLAVILVLHRRGGESVLAEVLRDKTGWPVKEAEEKEPIEPGTLYLAPPDYHLLIEKDYTFSLDYSEKIHYSRPAIDVTFETAAEAYGPRVIALLLSGANQDGTAGLQKIKAAGGYVLVQDPAEAIVGYMPKYAIAHVAADRIVSVKELGNVLQALPGRNA